MLAAKSRSADKVRIDGIEEKGLDRIRVNVRKWSLLMKWWDLFR